MKLTKYITIACIVTSLSGCDYLDFDESIGKTQDEMYTLREYLKPGNLHLFPTASRLRCHRRCCTGCGNRQCRIHMEQQQCVRHL